MVKIRLAGIADAQAIARVHAETWRATYSPLLTQASLDASVAGIRRELWKENLSHPKRTATLVAEADGEIVAFAAYGPEPGNDYHYQGELYAAYVLPAHQRRGIGTQLLCEAARGLLQWHLPNMIAWVLSSNTARQWFEVQGGHYLREREVEFGGEKLWEAAYGWDELQRLAEAG